MEKNLNKALNQAAGGLSSRTALNEVAARQEQLHHLTQNLSRYSSAVAYRSLVITATDHLIANQYDESKLAGAKFSHSMPDSVRYTHTFPRSNPIKSVREWAEIVAGKPSFLPCETQSVKGWGRTEKSLEELGHKAALAFALSYARAHVLGQAQKKLIQYSPALRQILIDNMQNMIEKSARALGYDAKTIQALRQAPFIESDYATAYIRDVANALDNHENVLRHMRREIGLKKNLFDAQEQCARAGLQPSP